MPIITWDESFSVNDIEIDNQHQKWIEIANELHDALMENKQSGKITEKTLDAMVEYAQFHFSYEEDFMKKINYPDLIDHKYNHSDFMSKLKQYQYDHLIGKMVLNRTIMKELVNWLQDHILKGDKLYATFLKNKDVE